MLPDPFEILNLPTFPILFPVHHSTQTPAYVRFAGLCAIKPCQDNPFNEAARRQQSERFWRRVYYGAGTALAASAVALALYRTVPSFRGRVDGAGDAVKTKWKALLSYRIGGIGSKRT